MLLVLIVILLILALGGGGFGWNAGNPAFVYGGSGLGHQRQTLTTCVPHRAAAVDGRYHEDEGFPPTSDDTPYVASPERGQERTLRRSQVPVLARSTGYGEI